MSVADLVSEFLQIGVISRLEALVMLWLVVPILYPQTNDLSSDSCISKIECGSRVEFNVLGRNVFAFVKEVAVNVEHFHCEAARLRNAVLFLRQ
jgi:hypothetical protein